MRSGDSKYYVEHARLEAILETALDAIISINSAGIIDSFNPAAEKLFDYSADEIIGKNISLLMPEPYASKHDSYLKHYESTGHKKIIGIGREAIGKRRNGSIFPIQLSVGEAEVDGKPMYVGFIHDISKRKEQEHELKQHRDHLQSLVEKRTIALSEANKKLEELANIDGLTGLANRRSFDQIFKKEISRATRHNHPISLIMCDIDFFKQFNDAYGHLAGDECLRKVAGCLKQSFKRASDLPARYGGEEFSVILPHTDNNEAIHLSNTFVENIRKLLIPHCDSSVSEYVTISIGVITAIPDKIADADLYIKAADEQLYKAKQNGRNRVEANNLE